MERRAILRYLVDLRSILLAFAIFNFTITWVMVAKLHFTCGMPPRYHPGGYLIGPTILLVSSLFLSANRWWGNTIALFVSGCFIGYFVHVLLIDDQIIALRYDWTLFWIDHPYLVGSQYLIALTVFCYSALSLKRNFLSRKPTAPTGQQPQY
jgi:hypothetical protein